MGLRFRMILSIGFLTSLMVAITLIYTSARHYSSLKENLIEQTRINLQIIAEYSSVPVVFEDKTGATDVLKKLSKIPHLVSAVIYDTKYVPFASFGNDSVQKISQGDKFFLKDILFRNSSMFMSVPLSFNGKRLGALIAEIDLNFREKQNLEEIIIFIALFIFLVIVSMILADGKVTNAEYNITYSLALKSGFTELEIPDLVLLLIKGIKCGEDEEDIFKAYRRRKFVS